METILPLLDSLVTEIDPLKRQQAEAAIQQLGNLFWNFRSYPFPEFAFSDFRHLVRNGTFK